MNQLRVAAIIVAAGSGRRMQASQNKIWLELDGQSLISHCLTIFQTCQQIDCIVIVVSQNELATFQSFLAEESDQSKPVFLVVGGKERQDSVANGLAYLKSLAGWSAQSSLVVIHDGARPLLTPDTLERSVAAGWDYQAVGVAVPVKDTIKQADEAGMVLTTLERSGLWQIQTPQVFDYDLISKCYQEIDGLKRNFSDDCSVAEYCGQSVKLILGTYDNIKITTPEDICLAEAFLRRRSVADRTRV